MTNFEVSNTLLLNWLFVGFIFLGCRTPTSEHQAQNKLHQLNALDASAPRVDSSNKKQQKTTSSVEPQIEAPFPLIPIANTELKSNLLCSKESLISLQLDSIFPNGRDISVSTKANATNYVAPTAVAFAQMNELNLETITKSLLASPIEKTENGAILVPIRYSNGNWTYFWAEQIRVYEVLKIRGPSKEYTVVLYNQLGPEDVIIDTYEATWNLALFDSSLKFVSHASFTTKIEERPALWDVISFILTIDNETIVTFIEYSHSGGGTAEERGFLFRHSIQNNQLCLTAAKAYDEEMPYPFDLKETF